MRASTAVPPAKANANGTNPAALPRLRHRDRVGEVREDPDEQLDREHRDGAAEDECGPALTRGESRQRNERERRDDHRPPSGHDLGPERIAMERVDVQLVRVLESRPA